MSNQPEINWRLASVKNRVRDLPIRRPIRRLLLSLVDAHEQARQAAEADPNAWPDFTDLGNGDVIVKVSRGRLAEMSGTSPRTMTRDIAEAASAAFVTVRPGDGGENQFVIHYQAIFGDADPGHFVHPPRQKDGQFCLVRTARESKKTLYPSQNVQPPRQNGQGTLDKTPVKHGANPADPSQNVHPPRQNGQGFSYDHKSYDLKKYKSYDHEPGGQIPNPLNLPGAKLETLTRLGLMQYLRDLDGRGLRREVAQRMGLDPDDHDFMTWFLAWGRYCSRLKSSERPGLFLFGLQGGIDKFGKNWRAKVTQPDYDDAKTYRESLLPKAKGLVFDAESKSA